MKKIILILIALSLSQLSYAEDLKEIIVTGTRNPESLQKVPSYVIVIDKEEIQNSGVGNVPELLTKFANVHFKTFNGNYSQASIVMRGFGGENSHGKVLILLNGRKLNNPDMGTPSWNLVPFNQIERIEVVKGTNTVLYGDSAVAGIVNIITKKGSKNTEISFSSNFGSNNTKNANADLSGSFNKGAYALNIESNNTDGWRERSGVYSKGVGFNLNYDLTNSLFMNFSTSFNNEKYEMPGSLTMEQIESNPQQVQSNNHLNDYAENKHLISSLGWTKTTENAGDLKLNLLYGMKDSNSDWEFFNSFTDSKTTTLGILPQYSLKKDLFGFNNHLNLGIDAYKENLSIDIYNDKARKSKKIKADVEKNTFAYYLRNEFYLLKDTIFAVGYRNESVNFKVKDTNNQNVIVYDENQTLKENAYELGLIQLIGDSSKIYGKYSTLYRFPFTDEKASYQGWGNDGFNKDLKAEKGKSYEVGTSISPVQTLNFELSVFNIDMKDEIAFVITDPATYSGTNQNVDETNHKGYELSISNQFKKLLVYANYTYEKATFSNGTNKGKELPFVPNHKVILGADYKIISSLLFQAKMNYVDSSYLGSDFDNSNDKLKSYILYDAFLRANPEESFVKS